MGFVVGLLELGTCVFSCLGDEDGPLYSVHKLFMCGALDVVDQSLLGALCAECHAQWFEEEPVCSFAVQAWFGGGVTDRAE